MHESELPIHWQFAVGQAFAGLEELVRKFDFSRLANGHTYVEIAPGDLIKVIDGFLTEPEKVVYAGNKAALQLLRNMLVEQIEPVYKQGLIDGNAAWGNWQNDFCAEELHAMAFRSAPAEDSVRGWYAEGFCFGYACTQLESLRNKIAAEQNAEADRPRETK